MNWIEDPGIDSWNGLPFSGLGVDEAYVNITSSVARNLWLYTLSEDCVRCPFERRSLIKGDAKSSVLTFSTRRNLKFRILADGGAEYNSATNTSSRVCNDIAANLGEFGVYDLTIGANDGNVSCSLNVAKDPVNVYLPLAAILCGLIIIAIISTFATYGIKKLIMFCKEKQTSNKVSCEMSDYGGDDRTTQMSAKPRKQRIRSIDTFRGLCVVIMIFVNDGGGGYWFLNHTTWDGLLLADCVFPWFLWTMGVCIPISIRSQLKRGVSRWAILLNIIKRAVILFALGLMTSTIGVGPDLDNLRIPGVLQRIAVSYFVVALLGLCFTPRTSPSENRFAVSDCREIFQDVIILFPQWIVILSVVAAHCYLVFFFPVPGCPSGYLGPGGIQDGGQFFNCVGGMTGYVDKIVLGKNHIFQSPTASYVYKSGPFDPEGILGLMPTILQVFLGVQAGAILIHHQDCRARLSRWSIWGLICGVIALILALPDIIPINKNLWSLSFVFTTSAAAYFLLAFIYFLQDHVRFWNGVPFKAPGMNPIIIYVGHELAYNLFPFNWKFGNMNTHFILTIESLWGTSLWIIIAYWLYYIEFFLSI
ncbi:UNVERIFIED_CONTAM: hypothetical protein PYX00_002018 [Menopon gallinae]